MFYFCCMTATETLEQLRKDRNNQAFKDIYLSHKEYCFNFMKRMIDDDDAIQDIYHDALIVLSENSRKKDFRLTCSVQTYLNSICRNQVLRVFKERARHLVVSDDYLPEVNDWLDDEPCEDEKKLKAYEIALKHLRDSSKNCYQLLVAFFYKRMSMIEIAQEFGYTNANNAKTQKSKCQSRLKSKVLELYSSMD